MKISEFLERFVSKLSEEGVTAPSYKSSKSKNRLIKSFWEQTFVLPVRSQSEIVYSSHLISGEVVKTIVNTSGEQWTDEDGTEEVPPEAKKKKTKSIFRSIIHVSRGLIKTVASLSSV